MSRRRYGGKIRNGRDRHHGMMGARSFCTVEIVQNSAPTTAKGCPGQARDSALRCSKDAVPMPAMPGN